jgi:hypothetical protein
MSTEQNKGTDQNASDQHWHVEGKNAQGQLLYSATVAAESAEVSGAPAAIAYACDRLFQNGYDARIVVTWIATLYCPAGAKS